MSRIDTLTGTLTVAVVLSIGFFIYQSVQDPPSKQMEVVTRQKEPGQKSSTRAVLADWTQERSPVGEPRPVTITNDKPEPAVLISTTRNDRNTVTKETVTERVGPEAPPILADVHFRFDRSGLSQETRSLLDQHLTILQDPKWSVLIQGHTDQEGTIQQNLRVGLHRAAAVKSYLIEHGVSPERIQIVSLGEYRPRCVQSTPECRHENRRVSFSLAHHDLSKSSPSTVTASFQPGPSSLPKDWHTSDQGTDMPSNHTIHEGETPVTPDSAEELEQSLVSLKAGPSLKEVDRQEAGTGPLPVGPIIPEPVHSTPPPTLPPDGQSQGSH